MKIIRHLAYYLFGLWVWKPAEKPVDSHEILYISKQGLRWLPPEGKYSGRKTFILLIEEEAS